VDDVVVVLAHERSSPKPVGASGQLLLRRLLPGFDHDFSIRFSPASGRKNHSLGKLRWAKQ
jgi:hypothetical protein